jgi:hypothetical protein
MGNRLNGVNGQEGQRSEASAAQRLVLGPYALKFAELTSN